LTPVPSPTALPPTGRGERGWDVLLFSLFSRSGGGRGEKRGGVVRGLSPRRTQDEDPPRPHQRAGRRRPRPAGAHGPAPASARGPGRVGGGGGAGAPPS